MTWLGHVFGLDNASGPWYLAWSGFVGDLSLLGAAVTLYRKHNCHQPRCWRIGRFPDGEWHVCGRHHPHERPGSDRG